MMRLSSLSGTGRWTRGALVVGALALLAGVLVPAGPAAAATPATGVVVDRSSYWFSSNFFAATSSGSAPTVTIAARVTPAGANQSVTWSTSNSAVATVNSSGVVTAVSAGVATIKATSVDGGFVAATTVHVPTLSDNLDALATGSGWLPGQAGSFAQVNGTVVAETSGKSFQSAMSGTGPRGTRAVFPVAATGAIVDLDFDWYTGAPTNSNGAYVALVDNANNRYLSLQRTNAGEMVYATGGSMTASDATWTLPSAVSGTTTGQVGTGFAANNSWFSVHAELNFGAQTIFFTVKSKTNAALTASRTVPFKTGVTYTGGLKSIDLAATRSSGTMSWTTKLDNVNLYSAAAPSAPATSVTVTNDQFWKDTDGNPIYSQGGGIFDFPDPVTGVLTHYWYGVHYVEAEKYYADPSHKYEWASVDGRGFVSIDVYSSLDLRHWKFENQVVTESELATMDGGPAGWLGRLGVAYVPSIGKYALLVQENNVTTGADQELALTSASPVGKFTNPTRIDMNNFGTGFTSTGDQTVFVDDDGKGYLIYSKPSGRNRLFVAEIIADASGNVTLGTYQQIYSGAGREGDCMFKYNGKYYFAASDLYGWNASNAYYLVADSIYGPYTPTNNMSVMNFASNDYSHVTQTGFFYTLHGSSQDTVVFAGDRWADFAGNGLGYNQWVPLSFSGTTPQFNSLSSWNLNTSTGAWSVGASNNYVINPSFEADRVAVSPVRGWTYSGTTAAILNQADNAGRVGNFHLAFTSASTYSASVSQNLVLNPTTAPSTGTYTLTAYARHAITDANATFRITVTSGSNSSTLDVKAAVGSAWQQVTLPNIAITAGSATVTISTSAVPGGQWANVDDLVLTRN